MADAPIVGVIMGSDSDLPTMSAACEKLKEFGIPFEVDIVSAHRTPGTQVAVLPHNHQQFQHMALQIQWSHMPALPTSVACSVLLQGLVELHICLGWWLQ